MSPPILSTNWLNIYKLKILNILNKLQKCLWLSKYTARLNKSLFEHLHGNVPVIGTLYHYKRDCTETDVVISINQKREELYQS